MQISPYPPSFANDPYTYAWALFSLLSITMFSVAVLGSLWRAIAVEGFVLDRPVGVVRLALGSLLLTIVSGSSGDVLYLLLWGEIHPDALQLLLTLDRAGDALCFPFFCIFGFLFIRGRSVVQFQLMRQPIPLDLWPTWPMVRGQARMILLILFIAAGVTLAK